MSFATRIFLGIVAVVAAAVAALAVAADQWLRRDLERWFAGELEREVRFVAEGLPRDTTALNAVAHRAGELLGRRITMIALDGRVLGDSDFDDASLTLLDNHLDRPEVVAALAGRIGTVLRRSESTDRAEMKVAIAAWPGVVRVSAPMTQVDALVARARRAVAAAAGLALVLGGVLAAITGRAVSRPVRALARAARTATPDRVPDYPESSAPEARDLLRALRTTQEELLSRLAELRREREETSALIESMLEGVVAADGAGSIVVCNSAARRILGFRPDEALPKLQHLFRQREAQAVVERVLRAEVVAGQEFELNGRAILATGRPLSAGGAVLALHDLTALRRLETVRRDFVANVSHELKTPLTNVLGYLETAMGGDVDQATAKRFLGTAMANARRMQRLVDDLLDLARVEAGGWSPAIEHLDVAGFVHEMWASVADVATERQIAFELDVPQGQAVQADPDALRHIFANLLDNAIRYTPPGGRIGVRAVAFRHAVRLDVSDTGAGIPPHHLPRVFERFYRVDAARSRAEGGTGLGLSIVKHLIEAHGGHVEVESTLGRGTTFRLTFPVSG